MGHGYIVSSTPYLVISRRPIYKVPTATLKVNPYRWKAGNVTVITDWPFNGVELIDTITTPTPGTIQEQSPIAIEIAKILSGWEDDSIV